MWTFCRFSFCKCCEYKIWLDPNKVDEISLANFIRNIVFVGYAKFAAAKCSLILCSQVSTKIIARYGKGTANARLPLKILWKRCICVMYHFLQMIYDTERINTIHTSLCSNNLQEQNKNHIIAVSLLLIVSHIYSKWF